MIEMFLLGAVIFISFYAFRFEIAIFFRQLYSDSAGVTFSVENSDLLQVRNPDILNFKSIWILIYTMIYFSILSAFNILKFRNSLLVAFTGSVIWGILLLIFFNWIFPAL